MIFGREPAFVIGLLGSLVMAVLTVLAGHSLVGQDVVDTLGKAIDPNQNGWLLPIVLGLITRFFVSPATKPGL